MPSQHLGPAASGFERRTGEPSRKRLDFEAEVAQRLARAREAGELERQGQAVDRSIIELSGDLETAKRDRQLATEVQQVAASGMADFRARFETYKQVEAGKQQAREAFERFKAEQQAKQPQQPAHQVEQQREKKPRERGWSR